MHPDDYTGTYQDRAGVVGTVQITSIATGLHASLGGSVGLQFDLTPEGPDAFYFYDPTYGFDDDAFFVRDDTGRIAYFSTGYGVAER